MKQAPREREARHPMRLVVERTGLSPDLLRAWERRYGVVKPGRSEGGQRLYADADLERLALVLKATQAGRPIGLVAALPAEELARLVAEDAERRAAQPPPAADFRERAFAAVEELAPERLDGILRTALLSLGAVSFLDEVVAPVLTAIGSAWHAGKLGIAQEHAATPVVRGVLGWLRNSVESPRNAPGVVVASLTREMHELGALLAAAAAAQAGWRVLYLGPDLPAAQLVEAARRHHADAVAVSVVAPTDAAATRSELQALRRQLPPTTALMVGGAGVPALGALSDGIATVSDLSHWRALLRAHAPAR